MKRNTSLALLFFGLIFSHLIILNFNLNGGFVIREIKFKLLPLLAFAGRSSDFTYLTSAIIGYILFAVFLFANFNRAKAAMPKLFYVITVVCIASVLFEMYCFYTDYAGQFTGQHSRVGFVLFLICLNIFSTIYKNENQISNK
jgi:hypothetical protein